MMLRSSKGIQKIKSNQEFLNGTVRKIAAAREKIKAVIMMMEIKVFPQMQLKTKRTMQEAGTA